MNSIYEGTYTVNSREIDGQNRCRLSVLLGYLQEAATTHACLLHVSREEMLEKYNCFWMLARVWCRLDRPLLWNEPVTVRTSYRAGKSASIYRDFDLFVGGQPVGEAVSIWVLADLDSRKLLRMSKVSEFTEAEGELSAKTQTLNRIHLPENMIEVDSRKLYYSDTDINGHVNNTRYADFACDALRLETLGAGRFVSELQLDYTAECRPGEEIGMLTGNLDGQTYVLGMGREGKARFAAALTYETCGDRVE